jgi:hypothetical protein
MPVAWWPAGPRRHPIQNSSHQRREHRPIEVDFVALETIPANGQVHAIRLRRDPIVTGLLKRRVPQKGSTVYLASWAATSI